MSLIYNPQTGLDIGDPDRVPLLPKNLPQASAVRESAASFILSASGWRKVFAFPSRGDPRAPWSSSSDSEDSLTTSISDADKVLSALMARTFGAFVLEKAGKPGRKPAVLLGMDSRPTGPAIADIFARCLLGMGLEVRYCFIISAPEIMTYAGVCGHLPEGEFGKVAGFAYISASHNPPGHNGVKLGLGTGGVLNAQEIGPLIASFKASVASTDPSLEALALVSAVSREAIASCFRDCSIWKRRALSAYTLFTHRVVTDEEELEDQARSLDELAEACAARPLGVVAELNGSARSLSIDRDFFEALGLRTKFFNDEPRRFARRIVPEGESLFLCMRLLDEAHAADSCFQIGYAPDCDGDRGNLVIWDEGKFGSRALEAQEVFALSCLAVLSCLERSGKGSRIAIVVNDATSIRIEWIADKFGAKVFRAETGEANVVALAESLRSEGWTVRILGEGSNGGTIVYPAKVRDPLATMTAMLQLLRLPDSEKAPSPYRIWLSACGRESEYRKDYNLGDVIATLPQWATTSVFEPRAALKVSSQDKSALKASYAEIFALAWETRKAELGRRYGIVSWKAFATLGTREVEVGADFAASGAGGLRIVFLSEDREALAHLWMRGSGTEPVFRIQADVADGTSEDEEYFLSWHLAMVKEADAAVMAAKQG
ncbi:MAG: hypothetical protein NT061_01510 [Spirochaetes bacterium]|nr:hypothetical protein [Spirochaetota bacterium]